MEHCLLHRRDDKNHKKPVGIEFKFSENKSPVTDIPLNMTFTISTFDPTISATHDTHPYVNPPRTPTWCTVSILVF
jgi:hypothetical protein